MQVSDSWEKILDIMAAVVFLPAKQIDSPSQVLFDLLCSPSTVLSARDAALNKTDVIPTSTEFEV